MPVHSLLILNHSSENILYSKYYDMKIIQTIGAIHLFERQLYSHTKRYWDQAKQSKQTCTINEKFIVLESYGDLLIIANGIDDIDECIRKLSHSYSLLNSLIDCLKSE